MKIRRTYRGWTIIAAPGALLRQPGWIATGRPRVVRGIDWSAGFGGITIVGGWSSGKAREVEADICQAIDREIARRMPVEVVFRKCSCGNSFTTGEFYALPKLPGAVSEMVDDDDRVYPADLVNCPKCHSTMAREIK